MPHTPGEWHAIKHAGGHSVGIYADSQHSAELALVRNNGDEEELVDNANLIIAAPDLLEACVLTLEALEQMTTEKFKRGADRRHRVLLRSAIAKARGQS